MSRILARDCGFKMVFQYLFKNENNELLFDEFVLSDEEKEFSNSLFNAVKNNLEEINAKISSSLKNNLTLKDIYKIDYAILLVCVGCVDYLQEPVSLCINESVELAKKYSTDKSPSFINGVLSSIYKKND